MSEIGHLTLLRLATVGSFALAIVNHLLPPKAFAATQLLFDYQFGLVRRGVVGTFLGYVTGDKVSVGEIYLTAAMISLAGAFAFYKFLARLAQDRISTYLVLILALNTYAFASFIGNTGYLDGVLLVVAVAALWTDARSQAGLWLRLGLCAFGVLVHENMLPYFGVLIGFDLWIARRKHPRAWLYAASPVLVATGVLLVLVLFAAIPPEQATAYAEHLQARAGFGLDPNSTDVARRTIGDNFALMSDLRGQTKYWAWVLFDGVPLLAMSLWLIWLALRVAGDLSDRWQTGFIIAAILAPLSLNVIAFDVVRFGVASVLAGFMVVTLLARSLPGGDQRLDQALTWPHFVLVLVLNANMFTIQVSMNAGHTSQFPWVLLHQLKWLAP